MDATFGETFFTLIGIGILVSLLPIFIAFWRGHPNRWIIFIVTIVFGATILGWLIALVWSLHGFHRGADRGSRGGESGLNLFADDVKMVRVVAHHEETSVSSNRPHFRSQPLSSGFEAPTQPARISINEAAELLERMMRLLDDGYLSEADANLLRRSILDHVR